MFRSGAGTEGLQRLRWLALAAGMATTGALTGCSGAGAYGFSKTYAPLGAEEDAAETAQEYDPVMAARFKDEWQSKPVSVFGVVKRERQAQTGEAYLTLSVRTLAPRNLCEEAGEWTCRVTVSEHEHSVVHANVKLSQDDAIGENSVGPGSLLRVIGKLSDTVDADDGNPVIRADFYRHWPQHFYVTTKARSYMRR